MTELLTAAQMRAIETAAIEAGEVSGLDLMERAGRGVVEAILAEWPELTATSRRAVVLCGPGNNGGDGFVVARLLRERGWEVEVFLYGDPNALPPDAKANHDRWAGLGTVEDLLAADVPDAVRDGSHKEGVLIDAVFGTGLSRPLAEPLRHRISDFLSRGSLSFLNSVAIDMPSGVCADSGRALIDETGHGPSWHYDLAVTFHRPRLGHYLAEAAGSIGKVVVKPLGLDEIEERRNSAALSQGFRAISAAFEAAGDKPIDENRQGLLGTDVEAATAVAKAHLPVDGIAPADDTLLETGFPPELDKAAFGPGAHKYSFGHALILSGGPGKGGAARLAARGALRIGAGLVTIGCPPDALPETAARLDAIMCRPIADADALARTLEDARLSALCLGPGLGVTDTARALVTAALSSAHATDSPTVLDADALTAFENDPDTLFARLNPACVLTPHGGEFGRLFPDIADRLQAAPEHGPAYSKVDATREAARRAGCTILFKGPDTVIAAPDGQARINAAFRDRAAPWLATAGSGDVLAGFITGLLARRDLWPIDAAAAAAWLHVEAAMSFGPGLIAEDLPEELPRVFRRLGL